MTTMEERTSKLEGAYEQANGRLYDMNETIRLMREEAAEWRLALSEKIDRIASEILAETRAGDNRLTDHLIALGVEMRAGDKALADSIA